MELRDALRTTGAVREFEDRPVAHELLYEVLETARFAPSGGNRQGWRVVVVDDPGQRRALRDCYLPGWYEYLALGAAGLVPFSPFADRDEEAAALRRTDEVRHAAEQGPGGFAEHLDTAPALLLVVADLRVVAALDRDEHGRTFVGGASIYPFAWSILLAAHDVGLGGVLTTMVRRRDGEVRARFGLEAHHEVAGLVVLGWPRTAPTKLRRRSVESFASIDGLDGPPLSR
jgi:nitroreductase